MGSSQGLRRAARLVTPQARLHSTVYYPPSTALFPVSRGEDGQHLDALILKRRADMAWHPRRNPPRLVPPRRERMTHPSNTACVAVPCSEPRFAAHHDLRPAKRRRRRAAAGQTNMTALCACLQCCGAEGGFGPDTFPGRGSAASRAGRCGAVSICRVFAASGAGGWQGLRAHVAYVLLQERIHGGWAKPERATIVLRWQPFRLRRVGYASALLWPTDSRSWSACSRPASLAVSATSWATSLPC
jgi:hypothetical protein